MPNVIWGVSVEDREYGPPRIKVLQQTPAKYRFLSVEPLLEDLGELDLAGIAWVIVGGESGPGWRKLEREWAVSIKDQCERASVPFFFKQWSGLNKTKRAEAELDGRFYREFPVVGLQPPPSEAMRRRLVSEAEALASFFKDSVISKVRPDAPKLGGSFTTFSSWEEFWACWDRTEAEEAAA